MPAENFVFKNQTVLVANLYFHVNGYTKGIMGMGLRQKQAGAFNNLITSFEPNREPQASKTLTEHE